MDFRILGPLVVARDGAPLDLGPRKQRMLLADLTLAAPRVVSTDRILRDLWGDEAEGRENALWVYVSRLRSILEPDREQRGRATVLVTRDHGYALDIDPDDVDAYRFERTAVHGAALVRDDPAAASEVLRAALDEWRGAALEEFADEEFAQPAITRLHELRLGALEDRISADLHRGLAGELVGELEGLLTAEPLRERLVGQLMLALYRSGRQGDALLAFERFRHRLADDLGLDPSPELRRLEEQVLLHDDRIRPRADGVGRRGVTAVGDANPYRGLRAFDEADATLFFGRERLVADVLRRIKDGSRFVALVGASGSGKSSVVRAGIVPVIRKGGVTGVERWLVARMVPGAHPFAELEVGLLRSSIDAPDSLHGQLADPEAGVLRAALRVMPDDDTRLLLVIDQFEELFTTVDADVRTRFLDQLLPLLDDPHGRIVVVITLRSDLYGRPLAHAAFGARLGDAVVNVVPLQPDELEAAALEPAARAGVGLEPALLATLVGDVIGQPGALPLFQYTLTELFERRTEGTLTLADYRELGGVRGALRSRAEQLYADLDETRRVAARQLFLRLVTIEGGDAWSRRRVAAAEVASLDVDKVAVQDVVGAFADARLLTLDRDPVADAPTVEVAHEALLTEWDRLRDWIGDARDDLRRHVALRAAIAEWRAAGADPDYLLTGSRLADYVSWTTTASLRPTTDERAFVDASVAADADRATAEAERVADEERLVRSARHRLWALVALLGVTLAAAAATLVTVFAPTPPRVGLITVGADHGAIGRQIDNGFEQAARDLDIEPEILVPISEPMTEVREYLDTGPDLVVVDTLVVSDFGIDVPQIVADYPDLPFAIIGSSGAVDLATITAPNAATFPFASETGSFLAGAAAALESSTGTVGFVGGLPFIIDAFRAGFEAGARHVDPDVTVLSAYTVQGLPAFMSQGPANEAAGRLYDQGADVVYHAAGEAGRGIHRAALEGSARLGRQLWSIGVDADEWTLASPAERPHVLTSMLKRHDVAIRLAVAAHLDGGMDDLAFTAGNGGLALSESGGHLSGATLQRVAELADAIDRGEVTVDPRVTAPPTSDDEPTVRVDVSVAAGACTGDHATDTAVAVGDVVTVALDNTSAAPVALEVHLLADATTFEEVAGHTDLGPLVDEGFPWTAATAVPDGAHAVTFSPTFPGAWVVSCRHLDSGVDQALAVVGADQVTAPVSAEAVVTSTTDACSWDGPSRVDVGDVIRIAVRNGADEPTGFGSARFVTGSDVGDIATASDELITEVGGVVEHVPPGATDEMLLHVHGPGTWAVGCFPSGGDTPRPAVLFEVG